MFIVLNEKYEIAAVHTAEAHADAWIGWAKTVRPREFFIVEGEEAAFTPKTEESEEDFEARKKRALEARDVYAAHQLKRELRLARGPHDTEG